MNVLSRTQNEGNARKERMNQRIMKQYEDAIKKHRAGKPVDFDELPTPPGELEGCLFVSGHLENWGATDSSQLFLPGNKSLIQNIGVVYLFPAPTPVRISASLEQIRVQIKRKILIIHNHFCLLRFCPHSCWVQCPFPWWTGCGYRRPHNTCPQSRQAAGRGSTTTTHCSCPEASSPATH